MSAQSAALNPIPSQPGSTGDELRTKFVELEYNYLIQSSFHTDDMRNKFIEFYLVLVGAAATAILGLADMSSTTVPMWAFSLVACLIGTLGVVMLPVFARARCVVLECLQGTVLLKAYVLKELGNSAGSFLSQSWLWDETSLPTDERYGTASFVLIFVFMLLDSAMFALAMLLMLADRVLAETLPAPGVLLGSLAVGSAMLSLQVMFYRYYLWVQINAARSSDRFLNKLRAFGLDANAPAPVWRRPVTQALRVGGLVTLGLAIAAWIVCR